jgi:cobalt-zinc-cadmium efflux system outer membrane protein
MTLRKTLVLAIAALALNTGCQSPRVGKSHTANSLTPGPSHASTPPPEAPVIAPALYQETELPSDEIAQPDRVAPTAPEAIPPGVPQGISMDNLEQMALANNPAIAQAAARVEGLRGKWVQVGLPPNPEAGYLGSELGNDGRGGQNGGFAGQEFVTGGKLRLNQAVIAQEIQQAEQRLVATQIRVQTDVRKIGYAVLIAQRRVELAEEILKLNGAAVQASKELKEAEEIPTAGLLQTEVEQQNAAILLQNAHNELTAAWQRLGATVGVDLPIGRLEGDVTTLPAWLNWDEQLARITSGSPELGAAMADVARAQAALQRARVEPIPNLLTQASVQYDEASNYTIGGLQAGVPLPLWNRNQGGIRQAQAEVAEARRNADRVELDLKRRLADAFRAFSTARNQADVYSTNILPRAQQTYELVQRGYRLGEVGYLDLLTAQRTFSQTNLAYLDSLELLWQSSTEIDGLLLSGSLESRPE